MNKICMLGRWSRLALLLGTAASQFACSEQAEARHDWTIGSRPTVIIADDGTLPTQFERIAGALRLQTGEIAIADAGAGEVRLFAPDGSYERTLVHRGNGPDELRTLGWLGRNATGIVVGSRTQALVLPYDGLPSELYFLARYQARPAGRSLLAAFRSGSFVASASRVGFTVLQPEDRVLRDTVGIEILPPRLEGPPRSVGSFPYQTNLTLVHASAPGGLKFGKHDFAPQLLLAAGDSTLWIGDSERAELVRVEVGDTTTRRVPLPIQPRDWDEEAIADLHDRLTNSGLSDADRYFALAQLDEKWRSEQPPYFRSLSPDVGGGVWVELFKEDATATPEYLVLDREGDAIARAHLPRAGRITELGDDYVLVVERDELDVERVVEYALDRGQQDE